MRLASGNSFLRVTLICGLILFVLIGGLLTFFRLLERGYSKTARREDSFYHILREYDISAGIFVGTEKEFEKLNAELDRLEKRTIGVESWLSVLKRRRALANRYPPAVENYRSSLKRAQKAYPQSEPITALAAASLVKDTALNKNAENSLRDLLLTLNGTPYNTLRLHLHVILGDFKNPQTALQLPELFSDGSEDLSVDLALVKILRSDYREAAADIQTVLNSPSPSASSINLAAEFLYDFGDLRRSAELFSRVEGEDAMIRQADALYLAGFEGSARSIWSILSESPESSNENSLYNMAVTADDNEEAYYYLEKLVKTEPASADANENRNSRQFGLVRYSRLLDYDGAIAALDGAKKTRLDAYPYIDLEKCRRYTQRFIPGRQIAETWLLLERHPEEEDLYEWAAWLVFFQRYYDEAEILLKRAEQFQFSREWAAFYRAILLMREGDLETAEEILRGIPAEAADWYVHANLGRILEAYRSVRQALEQYELAAAKTRNSKTASRIQHRIARCFSTLGDAGEFRRALEYALELDPENVTARLDLDRAFSR
ncbi:MAG: hypothetical protein LBQ82_08525 [Treponema sp.]|jgi:tetratricopeptide (TPR) repeat protein|nr:hypothetical protein [Treponema sp.]